MIRIVTKLFRFLFLFLRELLLVRIPLVENWHSSVNLLEEVKTKWKWLSKYWISYSTLLIESTGKMGCICWTLKVDEGDTFSHDLKSTFFLSLPFPIALFSLHCSECCLFVCLLVRLVDSVDTCDVCLFVRHVHLNWWQVLCCQINFNAMSFRIFSHLCCGTIQFQCSLVNTIKWARASITWEQTEKGNAFHVIWQKKIRFQIRQSVVLVLTPF